ncbi:MAG TPA: site-specific integrase [Acidobacteriaceae bacterium]
MLNTTSERYQHGSIRRVKRAKGFAWEFRYYVREGAKRILKLQTFDSSIYKTEKALRQHLEGFLVKLNEKTEYARSADVTFNVLLDRYIEEEMPARHSTKGSYTSIINRRLRPQWGLAVVSEIRPADLHAWFQSLALAPVTKGHLRSLMHKLFDLATLWEYLPLERRNPIEIVKIKNVTMRSKESVVLSPDQFRDVVKRLPENVNMIAVTMGCLGLRVSEALGLKWSDIDWELQTVTIRRSAYRGAIDETKTTSSKAKLPLHPALAELLAVWKTKSDSEWIFANPSTDMPYQSPSMQQRWIRPAGEAIGIQGLGFHSLRHSYRSWLDSAGIAPGVTKDLMRHSAISTTFNVYGRALSLEKREANSKVVEMLFPTPVPSLPPTTR